MKNDTNYVRIHIPITKRESFSLQPDHVHHRNKQAVWPWFIKEFNPWIKLYINILITSNKCWARHLSTNIQWYIQGQSSYLNQGCLDVPHPHAEGIDGQGHGLPPKKKCSRVVNHVSAQLLSALGVFLHSKQIKI